jgi:AcrR family transcriptional regulator
MARYQPGLRTEARIIAATGELLAEVGLEGTTLKSICDRAGIKSGSFYNLFDSKDEAVLRVVRQAITAVDPHPEGEGPDTVTELVDAYVRFVTEQPTVARIYLQIAVHGGLTDSAMAARFLRHHEQRVRRFAAAMSHQAEPDDGAQARAEVLLGALNGLAFRWALRPDFDFAALATSIPVTAGGTARARGPIPPG